MVSRALRQSASTGTRANAVHSRALRDETRWRLCARMLPVCFGMGCAELPKEASASETPIVLQTAVLKPRPPPFGPQLESGGREPGLPPNPAPNLLPMTPST